MAVSKLERPCCWYILKAANKERAGNEHIRILQREFETRVEKKKEDQPEKSGDQRLDKSLIAFYLLGAYTSGSALYEILLHKDDEGKGLAEQRLTVKVDQNVLDLINARIVKRSPKEETGPSNEERRRQR